MSRPDILNIILTSFNVILTFISFLVLLLGSNSLRHTTYCGTVLTDTRARARMQIELRLNYPRSANHSRVI